MGQNPAGWETVEAERYELFAAPAYRFALGRRDFCKLFGAGLVVALTLPNLLQCSAAAQESGRGRRGGQPMPEQIEAWLHIGTDGKVIIYTGKAEVGQNIRTSLSQAVAEELRMPIESIQLLMADTDLVPYDMGTFGSRTTPTMAPQLRRVAAAARDLLLDAAAREWKVAPSSLSASGGKVVNAKTGQSISYGRLAGSEHLVGTVPASDSLTPASEWKIDGAPVRKIDIRDFVTGRHQYAFDITRPGMLYGKVIRPDRFKATLVSADMSAAKAMPGVTVVRDGDFLGVAGVDMSTAGKAASAVQARWTAPQQSSSADLFDLLKKQSQPGDPTLVGSMDAGLAAADIKLRATYTVAYIAHAPLEPRAAVAEWNDGKLTVWTGSQRPFGVRSDLAQAFGIPEDHVRVIVPDTGSAYGGKHTGEAAVEAARLARAAGKPVKVNWSREEEMTWAYFRPAGVIDIRSGVRHDGDIVAWEHHNYNSGPSGINPPYDFPNQHIEFHESDSPLRQGSYRGLAATANHFARESHMDELAAAVKMDPLEFRLKNLKDVRVRAVFEAAASRFGWGKHTPAKGHGFGIAGGTEKGSYLATCAEVQVDPQTRQVKVLRVVQAFECGAIANPEQLRNLVAGAAMQGIGGALFEAIQFEDGRLVTNRFSRYRLPRFGDAPQFDVVLLDRKDLPSAGAGETPIVGVAPAIANAIANAAGVRLRSMPLAPKGII